MCTVIGEEVATAARRWTREQVARLGALLLVLGVAGFAMAALYLGSGHGITVELAVATSCVLSVYAGGLLVYGAWVTPAGGNPFEDLDYSWVWWVRRRD